MTNDENFGSVLDSSSIDEIFENENKDAAFLSRTGPTPLIIESVSNNFVEGVMIPVKLLFILRCHLYF